MVTSERALPGSWRRRRFWLALGAAALLGAVLLGTLADAPSRPLDPGSAARDGSRALARLLEQDGTTVRRTTSLPAPGAGAPTVVVTDPAAYSTGQLRRLAATAGRVVLVAPDRRAARALLPGASLVTTAADDPAADPTDDSTDSTDVPSCSLPAATAAGPVDWPQDVRRYRAPTGTRCYGGAVIATSDVVVLGSAAALTNRDLARRGVAALAINAVTDGRTGTSVAWLLPGSDAAGDGPASIWDLFPDGVRRAFWWLLAAGVLVALWRGRRLGGAVTEPLPVLVRAAELVEGHGRLYQRAGARERAARSLRAAAARRLADTLGMPSTTPPATIAAGAAARTGRPAAELTTLLTGPGPADDRDLLQLTRALDDLVLATRADRGPR